MIPKPSLTSGNPVEQIVTSLRNDLNSSAEYSPKEKKEIAANLIKYLDTVASGPSLKTGTNDNLISTILQAKYSSSRATENDMIEKAWGQI